MGYNKQGALRRTHVSPGWRRALLSRNSLGALNKMNPPTNPKEEAAAALIKGIVSAIPFAGGVISEVGNLYLNPLEKRKQNWMNEVCRAVTEIQVRFSRLPESLEADEAFVSFLYQATILALKNHQREKLKALSNALVSAADPERASEDLIFQFFRYIDDLSLTHLQILTGLEEHAGQIARLEQLEQVYAKLQSLAGLSLDRAIFRSFIHDLDARFLIRLGDLDEFPEYASKVSHVVTAESAKQRLEVTDLGRKFLSFVHAKAP